MKYYWHTVFTNPQAFIESVSGCALADLFYRHEDLTDTGLPLGRIIWEAGDVGSRVTVKLFDDQRDLFSALGIDEMSDLSEDSMPFARVFRVEFIDEEPIFIRVGGYYSSYGGFEASDVDIVAPLHRTVFTWQTI